MRKLWAKLSYRTQLTVMIATVMLVGGVTLLVVQYVVLQALLSEAVTVQDNMISDVGEVSGGTPTDDDGTAVLQHGPRWMQADPIVAEVLRGVQLWSGALLLVFVVLAILGAWLVSRQASRRIARVTEATNAITERDLSQRLALPGPDDEIKQLGTAIDSMVARLENAFTRQEAFIANASHEFRTPLATSRMALQLAVRQERVPEDLLPEVESVLASNRRMEELVGALLIVAQCRADAELPQQEVDIVALIPEVVRESSSLGEQTQLTVETLLPERPLVMNANKPLLRTLFANLVGNAIRHNTPGGFVRIELGADSECVRFEITNSGADSFDSTTVGRLTEPFHRGERSRLRNDDGSEAGTGLGLALVESITSLHRGSLELIPRTGGGLRVLLLLPQH
ncbi:sensor histidine kinase [Gulosibacter molinativorax]|uniref:histidine kinase n=1 Tax=Gulosibacter molinativorax TaxID=256821 RepID=A0ABT7C4Y2_9MICO|nr:ATP-binding protein [Gulosibacter molinativorax]MDJ1370256.1 HAMP domain-containing protein [Gulosibacter molinativorax]QUY61672.1 Putative two-component system sensor kinase [Gulosibacter molinativorax]